jgi:hypothetical protein
MNARKRPQLGVIVTQKMKDRIAELADDSGRSMGQQVEHMIERCEAYDAAFDAIMARLPAREGERRRGGGNAKARRAANDGVRQCRTKSQQPPPTTSRRS